MDAMWSWFAGEVKQIGKVDLVVGNGDLVDGIGHKGTIELHTTDVEEQAEIATDILKIIPAKEYRLVYGTPFHVDGDMPYENNIATAIGCSIGDEQRLNVNGKKFHFRHVGGRSDTPYGGGTQLMKEITRDMLQGLVEDYESADVFVRSHVHYFLQCALEDRMAVSTPCLEIPNGIYGRRLRTMYYTCGFLLIEVTDEGEVFVRLRRMPLKAVRSREYECLTEG